MMNFSRTSDRAAFARLGGDRLQDLEAQAGRTPALFKPFVGAFQGREIVGEGHAMVATGIPRPVEDIGAPERLPVLCGQPQRQPPARGPLRVARGDDREIEGLRRVDR